ncbi:hypothetical protein BHE74_00050610 [Ensete ventricosum]|nr:hypothetical protein GW17_00054095 [Ensete ventricosum]RWW43698.1 hypothetical protein BHE74_00050610 [Ensete ventricosum]
MSLYSGCCRSSIPGNLAALVAYHVIVPFHHARPCAHRQKPSLLNPHIPGDRPMPQSMVEKPLSRLLVHVRDEGHCRIALGFLMEDLEALEFI